MFNENQDKMNNSEASYRKIWIIAATTIAIAAMMTPGASILSTAYASNGNSVKESGNVLQSIDQSNSVSSSNTGIGGKSSADNNHQSNDAINTADVHISNGGHHHKHWKNGHSIRESGNVLQSIGQSNSISATNTGPGGSASANGNTQTNTASNTANVDIHNHGGSIKDSGNVVQSNDQSNSITASNSGADGSASANDNTQTNTASNSADVSIGNH